MKQFFKMVFASALGVIIAGALLLFICIAMLIGTITSVAVKSNQTYIPTKNTILKIDLSGSLPDMSEVDPFSSFLMPDQESLSLVQLTKAIRNAKEQKEIKGIYINSGMLASGPATLDALRKELQDFKKSGKFIVAYGDNFSQSAYYLSSVADSLYMNPEGMAFLSGLNTEINFPNGLLEKVGVEMQVFKVGTYKGAVEPFLRDDLSKENREQITSFLTSIWGNMVEGIATSRGVTPERVNEFVDNGLMFSKADSLIAYGLIDGVAYRLDFEDHLKEMIGQDRDDKLRTVSPSKLSTLTLAKDKSKSENEVALLYAEGSIADDSLNPFASTGSSITENVAKELKKLREDDDVKAVVFRVNSPGGSAFISEQIWHQVKLLKEKKPIVVSMGNYAASGGYYISCAANKIIAERNTLTGSIGIFGTIPNFAGTYKKLGVKTDGVKTSHFADFGSQSRPMRDDERALMQNMIERGYDLFISRCADGRGMTKEQIDAIGQGRVWTGSQALERGLVDQLGGIDDAIDVAAKLAELDDYKVVVKRGNRSFMDKLFGSSLEDVKLWIASIFVDGRLLEMIDEKSFEQPNNYIQARMPYVLNPM